MVAIPWHERNLWRTVLTVAAAAGTAAVFRWLDVPLAYILGR